MRPRDNSRRTRRWLPYYVGVVALVIIAGVFVYRSERLRMRAPLFSELEAITDIKARQIADWRNERLSEARFLSSTTAVAKDVAALLAAPHSDAAREAAASWLRTIKGGDRYASVLLLDENFNVQIALPDEASRPGEALRTFVAAAIEAGAPALSDLHPDPSTGELHLDVVAPVLAPVAVGARPRVIATVVLRIDPKNRLFPLLASWPRQSETAETALVRREGDEILFLTRMRHQQGASLMRRRVDDPRSVDFIPLDTTSAREAIDYRGVPVVAAAHAVPGTSWHVLAKVDQEELYDPVRKDAWQTTGLVGLGLLVIFFGSALVVRAQENHLLHRTLAAERERNAMAERLALVTRHANDIVMLADSRGCIIEANERAVQLLGYSQEDLRTLTALDLRAPDARAQARADQERIAREGGAVYTTTLRRKDGICFPVEVSGRRVTLSGETYFLGVIRDISERRASEMALRESEQRYRQLFEKNHAVMLLVDPRDGAIVDANPAAEQYYGWSREQLRTKRVSDLNGIPPEHIVEMVERARRTNHFRFNFEHRLADGSVRDVEVLSGPMLIGGREVLLSIVIDITERRRAEHALRLRVAALEAAANAIVIADCDGVIEWANAAFLSAHELRAEEAIGRKLSDITSIGREDPPLPARIAEAVAQARTWRGEVITTRDDGRTITEDTTVTPVPDETGRIAHVIAIMQDITEQKVLAAQFLQAQRLEAIGTLASGIAHDLNNILAPILLVGGVLKEKLASGDGRELLEMACNSAQRGAEVVRQLLTFSRGQPGEMVELQPRHLAREMLAIMRETFPREIEVRVAMPNDLWEVRADATQLHQVLLNLCVNARDAMPNGGALTLVGSNETVVPGQQRIPPTVLAGPYICLSVSDTGHGIPPDVLPRIFDPFFTTKPMGKGTGLGLSTVLGIVKGHGGFVLVDSRPGAGTTFKVFLPALTTRGEVRSESAALPTVPLITTTTILVVDDEPAVLKTTRMLLQYQKYNVLTAADGADALRVYLANRPQIGMVLTDLMMPVIGGLPLIRALRGIDPRLKILATSGLIESGQVDELKALNVPAPIMKPVDARTMLARVQECLRN